MTRFSSIRLLILAIPALAIELSLGERVSVWGGRPEPLLLLACFAAMFAKEAKQGLALAWVFGLLKDLGTTMPLGFHALVFAVLAYLLLTARQVLFREHPLMQSGIVFFAAMIVSVFAAIQVCLFAGGIPFGVLALKTIMGALLSALLAPVVMGALLRWRSFLRPHG